MRILTVVGARPQFVKSFPVSAALEESHEETLVHTGQHYDEELSDVFFDELDIPRPAINLGIGSGRHGLSLPVVEELTWGVVTLLAQQMVERAADVTMKAPQKLFVIG